MHALLKLGFGILALTPALAPGVRAAERLNNPSIESVLSATDWTPRGPATLTRDFSVKIHGGASLWISGRTGAWNGARQEVTGRITPGNLYRVTAKVRMRSGAADTIAVQLIGERNDGTATNQFIGNVTTDGAWAPIDTLFVANLYGYDRYYLSFSGPAVGRDFHVDNTSAQDVFDYRLVNFNNHAANSVYDRTKFHADFGNSTNEDSGYSSYGDGEVSRTLISSSGLRVMTLAGQLSGGGLVATTDVEPGSEYTLSYRVKFHTDFNWQKGGKLFGLSGGNGYAGGTPGTDGKGWSVRLMWGNNGRIYPYVYHANQAGNFGDVFGVSNMLPYNLTPNEWYRVKFHVKVNTGTTPNGILRIYFNPDTQTNDTLEFEHMGLRFATEAGYHNVNQMRWDCFFGGGPNEGYEPGQNNYIYFDDIEFNRIN